MPNGVENDIFWSDLENRAAHPHQDSQVNPPPPLLGGNIRILGPKVERFEKNFFNKKSIAQGKGEGVNIHCMPFIWRNSEISKTNLCGSVCRNLTSKKKKRKIVVV